MNNIQTTTEDSLVLVEQADSKPRIPLYIFESPTVEQLETIWPKDPTSILAVDFETKGFNYHTADFDVMGVGLACEDWCIYLNLQEKKEDVWVWLANKFLSHRLVAHNVAFDAGVMQVAFDLWGNWVGCTYGLFRHLVSEGFPGQKWNLETAELQVLGWPETNKTPMNKWLVDNGHVLKNKEPDKSQMWRAPTEIIGPYSAADADAAFQLYLHFSKFYEQFPQLKTYHEIWFMNLNKLIIEHCLTGIQLDLEKLEAYNKQLDVNCVEFEKNFLEHPDLVKPIEKWNKQKQDELKLKEPPRVTKSGKISKNWEKWKVRYTETCFTNQFNINSDKQLKWLFYEQLKFPVLLRTEESNQPSVADKALLGFGEAGKILADYREQFKIKGYVSKVLEMQVDGEIHTMLRNPGTLTGRLAGSGGVNLQQIPHVKEYLECWKARENHSWINMDICLHPKTELLTKRGWVPVLEILPTDFVWQVNKDSLIGSWVIPTRIINKEYTGNLCVFKNKRGNLVVTPEHKMLFADQNCRYKLHRRTVQKAKEGIKTKNKHLLCSTNSLEISNYPIEEIWKVCALEADGSLQYKHKDNVYRIDVSKSRKRKKLTKIFGKSTTINKYIRSHQTMPIETWYTIKFESPLLKGKQFNLDSLGGNQVDTFVDALSFWNGYRAKHNAVVYGSKNKYNIEQVQTYLVRNGYEAKYVYYPKKKFHTLRIKKNTRIRLRPCDFSTQQFAGRVGCVEVPEGFILVRSEGQTFITGNCSLEQVVLTELSEDPTLMQLYGPGAKPNDVYLFVGAHIPGLQENIRRWYNPQFPTEESIELAKHHCSKERSIAKKVTLSSAYGIGVGKLWRDLVLAGIPATFDDAKVIHESYWKLFAGVKRYEANLLREWEHRGGWIYSGLGLPLGVAPQFTKDLVNRQCQKTGHDILMIYLHYLAKIRECRGLQFKFVIADWHDQCIVECLDEDIEQTKKAFEDSFKLTNDYLQGIIKIEGEILVCKNLAEAKK